MSEEYRGTGQTTGLILQAIGKAVAAYGEEIEFVDHCGQTYSRAKRLKFVILQLAERLQMRVSVRRKGSQLLIKSIWTRGD